MATGVNEEKRTLTLIWQIKNIRFCEDGDLGCFINSPVFSPRTLQGKRLTLELTRNGKDEFLCLSLHLFNCEMDFAIDLEWSFISSNRSPIVSGTKQNHILKASEPLSLTRCLTHKEVFVTKRSAFLTQGTLTLRCRIWKSRGNLSNNEFISGQSRFIEVKNCFLWPVPGFSTLQLNHKVTTPIKFEFSTGSSNFKLKFSLTGSSLEDSGVNFELKPIAIPNDLKVSMKVCVLGYEQKAMEIKFILFDSDLKRTCLFPEFVPRKELLKKKSDCLKKDILTLRCEFIAVNLYANNSIPKIDYGFSNLEVNIFNEPSAFSDASCQTSEISVETLDTAVSRDISLPREHPLVYLGGELLNIFRKQSLSDFELHVDDVCLPVHKIILSAWSPVFRAMFSSDMKESNSNSQEIPDLDVDTLKRLLTFMYGGTVESQLPGESAAKLYYAADKYQVPFLKQECSSILRSNISVSNVSDILRLADRHQDKELTSFILAFLQVNFDEIMQSDEWENFLQTDPILAGKTTHQIYKNKLQNKLS